MNFATRLKIVVLAICAIASFTAEAQSTQDSLIDYYYATILNRSPSSSELTFWTGEIARLAGLGQEPAEVFIAMSNQFFDSAEYRARNRTTGDTVFDLYQTFLQRAPDQAGLQYWTDVLNQGISLDIILAGFQFSPEFDRFVNAYLGTTDARAEGSLVLDFYRGYLNRLPERGGLEYWISQFRAAQCTTFAAFAAQADAIAQQFQNTAEYAARNRSNQQFVGDLYSAFMRRAAESGGLTYWTQQLNGGANRASVRLAFLNSDEFQQRLAIAFQEGCYQPPGPPAQVISFEPSTTASGSRLVLHGSGFREDTRVQIDGNSTGRIEFVSSTQIAVIVPFDVVDGHVAFLPAGASTVAVDGVPVGAVTLVIPPPIADPPGQVLSRALTVIAQGVPSAIDEIEGLAPALSSAYPSGPEHDAMESFLAALPTLRQLAGLLPQMTASLDPQSLAVIDRALAYSGVSLNASAKATRVRLKSSGDDFLTLRAIFAQVENLETIIDKFLDVVEKIPLTDVAKQYIVGYRLVRHVTPLVLDLLTVKGLNIIVDNLQHAGISTTGAKLTLDSITGRADLVASITTQATFKLGEYLASVLSAIGKLDGLETLIGPIGKEAIKRLVDGLKKISPLLTFDLGPPDTKPISMSRLTSSCLPGFQLPLTGATTPIVVTQVPSFQQAPYSDTECTLNLSKLYLTLKESFPSTLDLALRRRTSRISPLTATPNPITVGQSVSLSATVAPDPSEDVPVGIVPTGTLTFFDDAAPTPCPFRPLVNGVAVCTTSPAVPGTHVISATFFGDPNFAGSTGSTTVTVNGGGPFSPFVTYSIGACFPVQGQLPSGFGVDFTVCPFGMTLGITCAGCGESNYSATVSFIESSSPSVLRLLWAPGIGYYTEPGDPATCLQLDFAPTPFPSPPFRLVFPNGSLYYDPPGVGPVDLGVPGKCQFGVRSGTATWVITEKATGQVVQTLSVDGFQPGGVNIP